MTRSIVIIEFLNFTRDKLSELIRVLPKWLWFVVVEFLVEEQKGTIRFHSQSPSERVNNSHFLDTIARMEAMKMIVILAASP